MIQSNESMRVKAASTAAKSSGGANETSGSSLTLACRAASSSSSLPLCAAARVTTTVFPASGDGTVSPTLPAHFFENILRPRFHQQIGHVSAELRSLLRRRRRTLLYILQAVHGTNARFEHQFAALNPRPGAKRYLASTMQRGKQRPLRDNCRARFGVVKAPCHLRRFRVFQPALHGNRSLSHCG